VRRGNAADGPTDIRFRLSGAHVVATIVAAVGASAVASQSWWLAPLLIVPLVLAVGVVRLGTDVGRSGLTARSLLSNRRVSWDGIEGFTTDGRKVSAVLDGGQALVLPAVRPADVPRVLAAGGREVESTGTTDATQATDAAGSAETAERTEKDAEESRAAQ
jgi:Bacterial PH domain